MKQIVILVGILVVCGYFYTGCPKIIKTHKKMLAGVLIGLLVGKYFHTKGVEGWNPAEGDRCPRGFKRSDKQYADGTQKCVREDGVEQDRPGDSYPWIAGFLIFCIFILGVRAWGEKWWPWCPGGPWGAQLKTPWAPLTGTR